MLVDQAAQRWTIERLGRGRVRQRTDTFTEAVIRPEPSIERHAETGLAPLDDGLWQQRPRILLDDRLANAPAVLAVGRQSVRELDDPVVHEWHPGLDTRRHAHLVLAMEDADEERLLIQQRGPCDVVEAAAVAAFQALLPVRGRKRR